MNRRCPEHAALVVVGKGELAEFSVVGARFGHFGVTFGRGIFTAESAQDGETKGKGTGLAETSWGTTQKPARDLGG